MTSDLLERCKGPFQQAIKDAGVPLSAIDHVVLVGGSTRMPAVVDLVKELTGGKAFEREQAQEAAEKLTSGRFTLEDFLEQMQQVKKMGPLQNLVGMLPGIPKELRKAEIDDKEIGRVEAIIRSMTPAERQDPSLMNGSRRLRVASRRSRSPSTLTPTASCTCRPRTLPPARSRA